MQALTEADVAHALRNATAEEVKHLTVPIGFYIADWDHQDFYAWVDPRHAGRGYLIVQTGAEATGIVLRRAEGHSRARSALCNICHTMQPGDQVAMFTARKAGQAGERGDSIGTMMCADLSCHDNVRLAAPLAPSEVRASVDRRIDSTRMRAENLVAQVLS